MYYVLVNNNEWCMIRNIALKIHPQMVVFDTNCDSFVYQSYSLRASFVISFPKRVVVCANYRVLVQKIRKLPGFAIFGGKTPFFCCHKYSDFRFLGIMDYLWDTKLKEMRIIRALDLIVQICHFRKHPCFR